MTKEQIIDRSEALSPWYHEIELLPGYFTKSVMLASKPSWENIRSVRKAISYPGKKVLDLGTMDGLWAFEAEKLGASKVIAGDVYQNCEPFNHFNRFLLAREALGCSAMMVTNADVHCLHDRMKGLIEQVSPGGFDIIQCLGLLYHVENPILALREIRKCIKTGGEMLLETVTWPGEELIARFNSDNGIYWDSTTFWAMTWNCLQAELKLTGWNARVETASSVGHPPRLAVVCTAI